MMISSNHFKGKTAISGAPCNERNRQLRGKTADKFPTNQKSQLGISTGNWRQ